MIDLAPKDLLTVLQILQTHVPDYEVRAFGSRYHHTAWKYSDLDLAVVGAARLPFATLAAVRIAFEESDLPFRVDVLDWHTLSPEFQQVIAQGYETIYTPQTQAQP
ncbi:MAG: nucleotidyltransferase domain-containing protein [Anaerolineales bacterium]